MYSYRLLRDVQYAPLGPRRPYSYATGTYIEFRPVFETLSSMNMTSTDCTYSPHFYSECSNCIYLANLSVRLGCVLLLFYYQ